MTGKIIKGIAGFYYVHDRHSKIYECKAKGIFRNQNRKPLVGDDVRFEVLDEEAGTGSIQEILPRRNELIRPAVANVDQTLLVLASKDPDPNYHLLNRFLVMMEEREVPCILTFSKRDLVSPDVEEILAAPYRNTGYPIRFISSLREDGMDEIRTLIRGKTTVLAGPSGVGKSTLLNLLAPEAQMETGEISEKIRRGRHTTRHSEIFWVEEDTFVLDTPGFSTIFPPEVEAEEIRFLFPEMAAKEGNCRFQGCVHINEPDCAVKEAVAAGEIHKVRYADYVSLYGEIKNARKY